MPLAILSLASGCGSSSNGDSAGGTTGIATQHIGGEAVAGGDPGVVRIQVEGYDSGGTRTGGAGCTAVVVNSRSLVTAAHCFEGALIYSSTFDVTVYSGDSVNSSTTLTTLTIDNSSNTTAPVACGGGSDGYHTRIGGGDLTVLSAQYDLGVPVAAVGLGSFTADQLNSGTGVTSVSYGPSKNWVEPVDHDAYLADLARRTAPVRLDRRDGAEYAVSSTASFCHGDSGSVLMHDGMVVGILSHKNPSSALDPGGCATSEVSFAALDVGAAEVRPYLPSPLLPADPACPRPKDDDDDDQEPPPAVCADGHHLDTTTNMCIEDEPWNQDGNRKRCAKGPAGQPITTECQCTDSSKAQDLGEVVVSCRPGILTLGRDPWLEPTSYSFCSCVQSWYSPNGNRNVFNQTINPHIDGIEATNYHFHHGNKTYPNDCFDPIKLCGSALKPLPPEARR